MALDDGLLDVKRERQGRRWFGVLGLIIVVQTVSICVLLNILLLQSHGFSFGNMEPRRSHAIIEDRLPSSVPTPHKFKVEHATPVQYQQQRGTCWDFTIVSVLEHSYRLNGIANGWLRPETYVQFSQQALGATLMRYCKNGHGKFCMSPGDNLWTGNSTEGAEVQLLYYVKDLRNKLLPHSVCPYTEKAGHDGVCAGMDAAFQHNPIEFKVRSMSTYYDRLEIKEHLVKHKLAMSLSATIVGSHFYLPCLPEFTSRPGMYKDECGQHKCMQCPSDHAYHNVKCCARIERPGYNMEGEFFAHDAMIDGGHAMTIVGYNDLFHSTMGDIGGWIVKNSWWDGKSPDTKVFKHARGSHSIAYFMLEVSDTDERAVCPNSYNPRNWYPCAGQNGVMMEGGDGAAPSSFSFDQMASTCTKEDTKLRAQEERRVLELQCHDSKYCSTEILHAHSGTQNLSAFCLPPLLVDDIAMFISPAAKEVRDNDQDLCGFYFFPYSLLETSGTRIGAQSFNVQGFDIDWSPSSYDRGPSLNPRGLDYDELQSSTRVQRSHPFTGDLPNMAHPQ